MWKCPVCEKENDTLLCGCGFDGSRDYEALPTFCELSGRVSPSKAVRKRQMQYRQKRLLRCGCGGTGFAFDLEQMALRCLQCGAEMVWDKNPGMPRTRPKQIPPQVLPKNTGFSSADEMLAALGLTQKNDAVHRKAKQPRKQTGKAKPANSGFSSAREMLEALGIQMDTEST